MLSPEKRITVVLLEDHPSVAAGISSWIRDLGYVLLGAAQTAAAGLALVRSLQPNIVIIDVCLNTRNVPDGIEITAAIHELSTAIGRKIAVLHMTGENPPNPGRMLRSILSRADGFYLKTDGAEPLVLALQALSCGKTHFDLYRNEHFAAMMDLRRRIESKSEPDSLTAREYEVFWFYVLVWSEVGEAHGIYAHVAERLEDLSARQVERHMDVIRQKLQVKHQRELNLLIGRAGYREVLPTFYADREKASGSSDTMQWHAMNGIPQPG